MNRKDKFRNFEDLFDYLCTDRGVVTKYKHGEIIYDQGQPDNRVYRIKSGGVAQSKRSINGNIITYHILGPDDIFSTYRLSEDAINQPCQAKALVNSEIQQVLKAHFRRYLKINPSLAIKVCDLISEELQARDETLEKQIYWSAKERIFSMIKDLAQFGYDANDGKHIDFLTRKELADMVGVTQETAIRSVIELEKEGKIKKNGREIIVSL
jgi:CRP-like cAMP-binding protein